MIIIEPYQPGWQDEFQVIGGALRAALGDLALRIDHIGSTSVPGLAAKDRIDIQITVRALTPEVEAALNRAGYQRTERIKGDHVPPQGVEDPAEWAKWFFTAPPGQRPTNTHVRVAGRANQRYALLFRDFLRASPSVALAYARVKETLAKYHGDDEDAYYALKDPVCDIIIGGAEQWVAATHWQQGAADR
jgi:GrpB-like predicted nucleotidyltransferase (UPF0157 family)